jgi:hypothetical protein
MSRSARLSLNDRRRHLDGAQRKITAVSLPLFSEPRFS